MSQKRVYIAGHNGMVGSALVRNLESRNDVELILKTRQELNLLDQQAVNNFFKTEEIDEVYLCC